jgi:bifunctional DNA-binding transcriptional regulator/antitoxin component of YhaV-PrlF toxin-antitoxin module
MGEVRHRGTTRITRKNQATLPVEALRAAGLHAGQRVAVEPTGPGRITIRALDDPLDRHAGALTGTYPTGWLDHLRDEWE